LVAQVASDAKRFGSVSLARGDFEQAELSFETALSIGTGDDADVYGGLGEALLRQGRVREAIARLTRAIALDSGRWSFRFNRGRAFELSGEWLAAAEDYHAATSGAPRHYPTQIQLGRALMHLERYEAAARAFERALEIEPQQVELLITLGAAYTAANQADRARPFFERFLDLVPDDPEAPRVRALLPSI
jgi:tetratricopeptide (TPR) repeat protein